ncbi:MAG: hypothetical protein LBG11_12265 [Bifidobacteriaceae bacterium]|jgi:hypothetical protein|nr:hypothetical protein [Bifidobacteriaceae bacterium]
MTIPHFLRWLAVVLSVLAALWFSLVWWVGQDAAKAYGAGDYELADERYGLANAITPFERWKPMFGQGTAVLASGNDSRAEGLLAQALELTPPAKECLVRVNLSLAQERQGDTAAAAGHTGTAASFYQTALSTLRDGDCPAQDETAAEAEQRLEEKLNPPEEEQPPDLPSGTDEEEEPGQQGGSGGEGSGDDQAQSGDDPGDAETQGPGSEGEETPAPEPSADPNGDRLERLEDQNRDSQRERQDQLDQGGKSGSWNTPNW